MALSGDRPGRAPRKTPRQRSTRVRSMANLPPAKAEAAPGQRPAAGCDLPLGCPGDGAFSGTRSALAHRRGAVVRRDRSVARPRTFPAQDAPARLLAGAPQKVHVSSRAAAALRIGESEWSFGDQVAALGSGQGQDAPATTRSMRARSAVNLRIGEGEGRSSGDQVAARSVAKSRTPDAVQVEDQSAAADTRANLRTAESRRLATSQAAPRKTPRWHARRGPGQAASLRIGEEGGCPVRPVGGSQAGHALPVQDASGAVALIGGQAA